MKVLDPCKANEKKAFPGRRKVKGGEKRLEESKFKGIPKELVVNKVTDASKVQGMYKGVLKNPGVNKVRDVQRNPGVNKARDVQRNPGVNKARDDLKKLGMSKARDVL